MVLTVILAPLCIALVVIIFMQWQRINEIKHDKKAALTKADNLQIEMDKRLAQFNETCAQKDDQINRQQKEIVNFHNSNQCEPVSVDMHLDKPTNL